MNTSGFAIGSPVYAQDGDQLGKIKEVRGQYVKVDVPMAPDYWLRTDALRMSGNGLTLAVDRDRLADYQVANPDDVQTSTTTGTRMADTTTTTTRTAETTAMPAMERTRMNESTRGMDLTDEEYTRLRGMRREDLTEDQHRRLQLREEQLLATKTREEAGEVEIRKEVIEEQRSIDVPVTREEVYIERRAVNEATSGPIAEDGEVIRVPVMEEHAQLEKQTVVREELEIGKRAVQETEHLQGTVRREEARIETEGDVDVNRGGSTTSETRTTQDRNTGRGSTRQ